VIRQLLERKKKRGSFFFVVALERSQALRKRRGKVGGYDLISDKEWDLFWRKKGGKRQRCGAWKKEENSYLENGVQRKNNSSTGSSYTAGRGLCGEKARACPG